MELALSPQLAEPLFEELGRSLEFGFKDLISFCIGGRLGYGLEGELWLRSQDQLLSLGKEKP